jgi:aspartyl-tRNA(Asn)/glutamyl-tRNA(Gln) amidotransferase subunit C
MVTREEWEQLALLAKLEMGPEEMQALLKDMDQFVAFVDAIGDYGDIQEEPQPMDLSGTLREDEILPSSPQEAILQNVAGGEEGFFPVRQRG